MLEYQIPDDYSKFVNISSIRDCGYRAASAIISSIQSRRYSASAHPPWNAAERECEDVQNHAFLHVGFLEGQEDRLDWLQLAQIFQALATAAQRPYWYNYHCVVYVFKGHTMWSLAQQYPRRGEDTLSTNE